MYFSEVSKQKNNVSAQLNPTVKSIYRSKQLKFTLLKINTWKISRKCSSALENTVKTKIIAQNNNLVARSKERKRKKMKLENIATDD